MRRGAGGVDRERDVDLSAAALLRHRQRIERPADLPAFLFTQRKIRRRKRVVRIENGI